MIPVAPTYPVCAGLINEAQEGIKDWVITSEVESSSATDSLDSPRKVILPHYSNDVR